MSAIPDPPLHNLLICCGPGPCHPGCPVKLWRKKYFNEPKQAQETVPEGKP